MTLPSDETKNRSSRRALDRAHHGEDPRDLARIGGDGAQQLELLLDRNRERVGDDLGPVGIAVGRCRRQLDRLATERGIGPRDLDGLDGRAGDGLAGHFVRGREPPGAVGQHAESEAERTGVRDRRDLDRLAGRAVGLDAEADVLAAIAVDPDVGVRGAGRLGPLDRERRQLAEPADIELGRRGRDARPVAVAERGPHRRAGPATTEKCPSRLHRGRLLLLLKHDIRTATLTPGSGSMSRQGITAQNEPQSGRFSPNTSRPSA